MKVLYGLTIAIAFVVTSPGRDRSREKAAFSGGTGGTAIGAALARLIATGWWMGVVLGA